MHKINFKVMMKLTDSSQTKEHQTHYIKGTVSQSFTRESTTVVIGKQYLTKTHSKHEGLSTQD